MKINQKRSIIITSIVTPFILLVLIIIFLLGISTKKINANQDSISNNKVLANEENEVKKSDKQQLLDLYNNGQTDMTNKVDVKVNFYDLPESIREALEEDAIKRNGVIDYGIPFTLSDFQE